MHFKRITFEVREMEKIEIGTKDGKIYEGRRFELRIRKMILGFDVSWRVK